MKLYKRKEVVTIEEVLEKIICDTCEEEIEEDEYYEVTVGHSRWGNDSVDSIEHHEFCSYDCTRKHMDKYFEEKGGYSTRYEIEIETR